MTSRHTTSRFDLMAALEAVYAVDCPAGEWLRRLVEVIAPMLDQGEGGCAYFVDTSRVEAPTFWGFVGPREMEPLWLEWFPRLPVEAQVQAHRTAAYGTMQSLGPALSPEAAVQLLAPTPYLDMMGVNGVDAEGRGVSLAFPARHIVRMPSASLGRELAALSTHLARAAALVLPRATDLEPRIRGAAVPGSPTRSALGTLGLAALRQLAVRSLSEYAPLSAAEVQRAWQDLELRRLVRVDDFEAGGRSFTIAIHPRTETSRNAELTEREREAADLAAAGLSNKLIADSMGVGLSTVSTLLSRAAAKLGVGSRVALVRARRQLEPRRS